MPKREVKLAYVTKYAVTRGIIIVRDATTNEDGRYLSKRPLFIGPAAWTEDKAEAEKRFLSAINRKIASAEKQISALKAKAIAGAPYEEFDR